jgi:hypothetical protein
MAVPSPADIFQLTWVPIKEISMMPIEYVSRIQAERVPLSVGSAISSK